MALRLLSATDVAIAVALKSGNLRIVERTGRLGQFWSIEDERGLIEVALSAGEADLRVRSIQAAL